MMINGLSIIAIIPARGGSKGIPRKNIKLLNGKPLIVYSIEHALKSKYIDRTLVSTEDSEISQIAKQYRSEVIKRPIELAGDTASSESALLHVLEYLEKQEKYLPDIVVFLQATSPLRQDNDIDNAIEKLIESDADSLFSCYRTHDFYWHEVQGQIQPKNYDFSNRPRRQERNPEYVENGSIYITKSEVLKQFHNRLGGKITYYEMSRLDSFQIDEPDDFTLIEHLMNIKRKNNYKEKLQSIKGIFLDFDGVITDNRVIVSQDGAEAVICNRSDGMGIELLKKAGFPVIVISKEKNLVVSARCEKLGIPCYQGEDNKLSTIKKLAEQNNIPLENWAYMGNDINDLECMKAVGVSIAVADAHRSILNTATIVLKTPGGKGAIRELAEMLLNEKQ